MTCRSGRATRTFLLLVLAATVSTAHGADSPCARAITKSSAKYVLNRAKAIQRCHDARAKGDLPAATNCESNGTVVAITTAARSRFAAAVASKCGGNDGSCGTGDDLALSSYGWGGVGACPSLQSSACAGSVTNCAQIVTC